MVGVFYSIGVVARLQRGVVTNLIDVEDRLVDVVIKLVEMSIRVVIVLIFNVFWPILKQKLLTL